MALKTFFVALKLFDGSIEGLENFLKENSKLKTIFDCEDSNDPKQKLLAVNASVFSESISVTGELFEDILTTVPSMKLLFMSHSPFIRQFLEKQTWIGTLNYHEIYAWPLKRGGLSDLNIEGFKDSLAYKRGVVAVGNASYPVLSLFNHSCSPNVSRIFIDDKVCMITTRSIDQGEQIFDNYGYNFTNVSRVHRQAELLMQYRFKCNCTACIEDWPLLPGLKVCDKAILNKAKKACRELSLNGPKKAAEKYRELCEIVNQPKGSFPSLEICSVMESAAAYLEMILKPSIQFP